MIELISNFCLTYYITSTLLVGFKSVSRGVALEEPGGLDCSEKTAKVADNRQDNGQVRGRCWLTLASLPSNSNDGDRPRSSVVRIHGSIIGTQI